MFDRAARIRKFIAGLALAAMAAVGFAEEPIVIKFSHVVAADTPKGLAAQHFKKLAEERSRGRVRVEVYPDSQLFKDQVELAALELGTVQMIAPSLSKLSALGLPEFEVFDLPYVFQDLTQVHRVTAGPIGHDMLKRLNDKGIVGLAFWDNGFKQMSANRPLHVPADIRGLKMRIQMSRVISAQMRALGVQPQPMAFSDTYQALRSGVVDGSENSLSNFYTQKMHLAQKYLTLTNHGYLGYVVMVNKRFWDALPGDIRDTLETAMKDSTRFANDIAERKNEEALEAVRKSQLTQIIALSPDEKQQWIRALVADRQEQTRLIGKDLLHAIYRETGFDPTRYTDRQEMPDTADAVRSSAGIFWKWSKSLLAVFRS